jgi:cell division protein FtsZ
MVKEGLINLDFADVRAVMREMGKAMMGTGEASGDRRAIQAAEAAIANPLLDETSMKGARGLLISITGGKDLTLYEVDEAATRIREEVDEDANIILGATFDDSLEGIIRVSVVATGIESALPGRNTAPQNERVTDTPSRGTARAESGFAPAAQPVYASQATLAAPAAHTAPVQRSAPRDYGAEPQIPTAQAGGVTIRPFQPSPSLVHEPQAVPAPVEEPPQEEPYIPPEALRPDTRTSRMPRLEDFPQVAQSQFGAREQEQPEPNKRLGLLRRLASVGLGLRDEPEAPAVEPQTPPEPVRQEPQFGAASVDFRRPQPSHAGQGLYRPRQGDLDPHGRTQAPRAVQEDDHLEIPAFLRRQSN